MKKLLISLLIVLPLFGETIKIDEFVTDIYSKNSNSLKKIEMSLVIETNTTNDIYKVKDALNIVVSSFYVEDLFTSKSKEAFKIMLQEYTKKKYIIDIKNIYIQSMQLKNSQSAKEILKPLKQESIGKDRDIIKEFIKKQ